MLLDSIKRYEGQMAQYNAGSASNDSGSPALRRKDETVTTGNEEKKTRRLQRMIICARVCVRWQQANNACREHS